MGSLFVLNFQQFQFQRFLFWPYCPNMRVKITEAVFICYYKWGYTAASTNNDRTTFKKTYNGEATRFISRMENFLVIKHPHLSVQFQPSTWSGKLSSHLLMPNAFCCTILTLLEYPIFLQKYPK